MTSNYMEEELLDGFRNRRRFLRTILIALVMSIVTGLGVATAAWAGTDDYPPQWHNAAQDSLVDSWGYYNRECTSFVAWRLHSRNGFEMPRAIGNAGGWGSWFAARGYAVNNSPAVGSIAESSGHVAWVEAVNGDGTVTVEEYNYNFQGTYRERRVASSTFHFIHVKDMPTTTPGSPIGNFELVSQNGTGVRFRGWARDPDTDTPIAVHAYVTPNHGVATTADLQRGDVGAHAFDVTRGGIIAGTYNVCVYGINAPGTPGDNTTLGCRTIAVTQSPIGNFEAVSQNGTGVRFRGWAIDPDTSAPIAVHAYVTPNHGVATTADILRADVGAEQTASGPNHGFDVTRGGIVAGTYNACAYGINAPGTPGENVLLGCQTITLTQSPIGALDAVEQDGSGVRFRGWAIDPDTSAPIAVHAYVTPNHGVAATADLERLDVGALYTASGANHGFVVTRGGIVPGSYNVCAYGINVPGTAGDNALLGCRSITLT